MIMATPTILSCFQIFLLVCQVGLCDTFGTIRKGSYRQLRHVETIISQQTTVVLRLGTVQTTYGILPLTVHPDY